MKIIQTIGDSTAIDTIRELNVKTIEKINQVESQLEMYTNQLIDNQEKILSDLNNPWENIRWVLLGAFLGLVLPFIAQWIMSRLKYSKYKYKEYKGWYIAYMKYNKNREDYFINLDCSKNEFIIKGISIRNNNGKYVKRHPPIAGEIVMSNSIPKSGSGHYIHEPNEKGEILFGFYNVQLKSGDILVHHMINNRDNKLDTPAYIWKKVNPMNYKELIAMYNEQINHS